MPKISFIQADARRIDIEVAAGTSAMRAAIGHGIAGIVAECGGAMMCATCHVCVDPAWIDATGEADPVERDMLEYTDVPRRPTSRLGCQLVITDALDGLVLHVPGHAT